MSDKKREGSFKPIFIVMLASLVIAFFWDKIPAIKNTAHLILDPSAGALLNWNVTYGMALIVLVISVFMSLLQKYATDQETLRGLKKEQKELQTELKKLERGSKEYNELSLQSLKFMGPMMKLSMRPIIYTGVPLILFFRWFMDFFSTFGEYKFFGFLSWFWFYLIGSMIFSMILRKVFKVV